MSWLNNWRRAKTPTINQEQVITWQFVGTGTSVGTTGSFLYPVSDIIFTTNTSGGETISVSATLANLQTATPIVYSKSTGLPVTATTLASGTYYIKQFQMGNIRTLTFTKSAGVNNGVVSGVAVKQSYNTQG